MPEKKHTIPGPHQTCIDVNYPPVPGYVHLLFTTPEYDHVAKAVKEKGH